MNSYPNQDSPESEHMRLNGDVAQMKVTFKRGWCCADESDLHKWVMWRA
jgi:hypothetical protein